MPDLTLSLGVRGGTVCRLCNGLGEMGRIIPFRRHTSQYTASSWCNRHGFSLGVTIESTTLY